MKTYLFHDLFVSIFDFTECHECEKRHSIIHIEIFTQDHKLGILKYEYSICSMMTPVYLSVSLTLCPFTRAVCLLTHLEENRLNGF